MANATTLESILTLGVIFVLGMLLVVALGRIRGVVLPSLLSLIVHFLASIVLYRTVGLFSPDAKYYNDVATAIASNSISPEVTAGKEGWPNILAALYKTVGADPQVGLWINSVAAALLVLILAEISFQLSLPTRLTAWMAALLPGLFIWSVLLLREAITWVLISLMALGAIKLTQSARSVSGWMFLAAGFFGLLSFRGTAALLVLGSLIAAFLFVARRGAAFVVTSLAVLTVAVVPEVSGRIAAVLGTYSIQQVELSREALSRNAESAFTVSSGGGLLEAAVNAAPRVLLGPYPWEWASLGVLFALDAAVWVIILILTVRGMASLGMPRIIMLLVVPAVALLAILAVTSGNYGTLIRLRMQAGILIIPIAAMGLYSLVHATRPQKVLTAQRNQIGDYA